MLLKRQCLRRKRRPAFWCAQSAHMRRTRPPFGANTLSPRTTCERKTRAAVASGMSRAASLGVLFTGSNKALLRL